MASRLPANRVLVLAWKDLVVSSRRPIELASILVFAAAAAVVVSYAAMFTTDRGPVYASSLFLVPAFLSMFAALSSFIREAEEGTLEGLKTTPLGGELLYAAKLLYTLILIGAVTIAYELLVAFFTGGDLTILNPGLQLVVLSYVFYLSAVSSLASAMLVYSESRGLLVPIVILVLVLPAGQAYIPVFLDAMLGVLNTRSLLVLWSAGIGYALAASALSRAILA